MSRMSRMSEEQISSLITKDILFRNIVHDNYILTFYADGTYRYTDYDSETFSWWIIKDNTLYFNHVGSEVFTLGDNWKTWPSLPPSFHADILCKLQFAIADREIERILLGQA